MNQLELAFAPALNQDLPAVFETQLLALILGLVVMEVYRYSVSERIASPPMQASLVLLAMIGSMVMMIIGNNIARAFSLVGALAIIRFRTRLRSPWDITFIFFSLAVGIAVGVGAFRVAVIGGGTVALAVLALQAIPGIRRTSVVHDLRCDLSAYEGAEEHVETLLSKHFVRHWLQEVRSLRFGETFSYRYRVMMAAKTTLSVFLQELSEIQGVERVVLSAEDESGGTDE